MSIYATNYTVDETTGEVSLIKHLNKVRVDRGRSSSKGWNKSGKKARHKKMYVSDRWNKLKHKENPIRKYLNKTKLED